MKPVYCSIGLVATMWSAAAADDNCADVLRIGLTDSYSLARSSTLSSAVTQWVCDSASNESLRQTSVGAVIPIPELAAVVGVNYDAESVDRWRATHCSQSSSMFNATDSIAVATAVLSPFAKDAIAAWTQCRAIKAGSNGPSAKLGDYAANDPVFTVTLDWTPSKTQLARPKLAGIEVTNAECTNVPAVGTDYPDRVILCQRKNTQRALFVINTTDGPVAPTPILPAVERPTPPAPDCYSHPCASLAISIPKSATEAMPGSEAEFVLRPSRGSPRMNAGKLDIEGTINLTFEASTPTWSNSPYRFEARLEVNGKIVASRVWSENTSRDKAGSTMSFTWTLPLIDAEVGSDNRVAITLRVGGGWTYRNGDYGNPPDRVRLDGAKLQLQTRQKASDATVAANEPPN